MSALRDACTILMELEVLYERDRLFRWLDDCVVRSASTIDFVEVGGDPKVMASFSLVCSCRTGTRSAWYRMSDLRFRLERTLEPWTEPQIRLVIDDPDDPIDHHCLSTQFANNVTAWVRQEADKFRKT